MPQKIQISDLASRLLWMILIFMLIPSCITVMNNTTTIFEWCLYSISSTPVMFTVITDPFGLMFSCTVLMISANVMKFSTIYMRDDVFINRFTTLVLLFVLSMNMLIFFPHLIMLLLGWDGLGIVSFILVIYYQNYKSLAAGMITALTNRIGDVMLLLAIAWTLNQGHWSILHMWETLENTWQILAITVAAMTKSAQMPFSSWLPAAMAAPTPVSALVHSSTLVTAGVFLLIRFYNFLSSSWWFSSILLLTAVSTTVMAGLSAITECDMKKIIALSTLSQLGMMMAAMGLNMVYLAYFHMITHALFKALLFICAGSIIHNYKHSQDLRWMGNLTTQMPTVSSCLILANFALCGFPFMSGFYSKDMIVEASLFYSHNMLMLIIIMLAVGLTSFYSFRFSMCVIWGPNNSNPYNLLEESSSITAPTLTLATMSIFSGALILWAAPMKQECMMIPLCQKIMPLVLVMTGSLMAWMFYSSNNSKPCMLMNNDFGHSAYSAMWFLVPLSSQMMMKMPMNTSHNYLKLMDRAWTESFSGQRMKSISTKSSNILMSSSSHAPVNYLIMSAITGLLIIVLST